MATAEQIDRVREIEQQLVAALKADGLTVDQDRFGALSVKVCGRSVRFHVRIGMSGIGSYRTDRFHSVVSGTWMSGRSTLPSRTFDGEVAKHEETIAKVVSFVRKRVDKIEKWEAGSAERNAREKEERNRAGAIHNSELRRRAAAALPVRCAGFTHMLYGGIEQVEPGEPLTWFVSVRVPVDRAVATLELLEAHGLVPKREASL